MKPVYLPMPVSFEEKREWNKNGYQVLDVAYAPDDYVPPEDGEDSNSKQKPKKPPL